MCLMQWLTVCSWHLKWGALGSIYDHCQVFISGYFISYVHHVVASCYPLCGFHGNAFGCVVHVRPDVQQLGKWSYTTLQYACGFFQVLVCSVCEHSFHGFPGTSVSVYGMECWNLGVCVWYGVLRLHSLWTKVWKTKGRGVYFTSKPFQLQLCISLRNYHKFPKTRPLWTNALPSLQPPSSYIGVFPCVNARPVLSVCLVSFWFSSVVDWVHEHVCTTLLSLRFQATTKVFVAHTGNTSLRRVVSRYTDTASCFSASWLSINTSAADFQWYTFSEAAILSESRDSHRDCWICVCIQDYDERRERAYVRTRRTEYSSKCPLPTFV